MSKSKSKIIGKMKLVVCDKCSIQHDWESVKEKGCWKCKGKDFFEHE